MLRRRLLSLAAGAVAVLLVAPAARAQSSFTASGGPVEATVGGWGFGVAVPLVDQFRLVLLDATNTPTATLFTYSPTPSVLPPVSLGAIGVYSPGEVFRLGLVALATGAVSTVFSPIDTPPNGVHGLFVLGAGTDYRSVIDVTLTHVATVNNPVTDLPVVGDITTTAPEPASVLLFGTGLLALGVFARRHRRAAHTP